MITKFRLVALSLLLFSWNAFAQFSSPVVIYSTSWCPYCKQAKAYFESLNVPYIDNDIESSPQAREAYKSLDGKGIPLVFIGNTRFDGYDPASFEQALITEGLIQDPNKVAQS